MTFKYRYRKQIIIISSVILLIGLIVSFYLYNYNNKKKEINKNTSKLLESTKKDKTKTKAKTKDELTEIMVDVKGEVINAGIYTLKTGSRVIDAINMAGGLTNKANTSVLNLSKKLTDEMVIIVYSNYEVENFKNTKEQEEQILNNCITGYDNVSNDACITNDVNKDNPGKVSINNASIEELMTLTGIGESKAKSIIEYREQNGGFKSIEDIKNVTGIGEALFDKIKENITL